MYSHFLSRFSISQSFHPQTKILNSRLVKFTITDHWLDRSCQLLIDSFLKVAPRYEVHPSFFIQKHIQDPGSLMNIKFKVSMPRLSQVRFLHMSSPPGKCPLMLPVYPLIVPSVETHMCDHNNCGHLMRHALPVSEESPPPTPTFDSGPNSRPQIPVTTCRTCVHNDHVFQSCSAPSSHLIGPQVTAPDLPSDGPAQKRTLCCLRPIPLNAQFNIPELDSGPPCADCTRRRNLLDSLQDAPLPASWSSSTLPPHWLAPDPADCKFSGPTFLSILILSILVLPWYINPSSAPAALSVVATQRFLDRIAQHSDVDIPQDLDQCLRLIDDVMHRLNRDHRFYNSLRQIRDDLSAQAYALVDEADSAASL
jgi:hypothetical protein